MLFKNLLLFMIYTLFMYNKHNFLSVVKCLHVVLKNIEYE